LVSSFLYPNFERLKQKEKISGIIL